MPKPYIVINSLWTETNFFSLFNADTTDFNMCAQHVHHKLYEIIISQAGIAIILNCTKYTMFILQNFKLNPYFTLTTFLKYMTYMAS